MTGIRGLPPKQGLYDPQFEHDACGIGLVAHIKGTPSHNIIRQGIQVLKNLDHRGAQGSEPNSGDGAGILLQIPHTFFAHECGLLKMNLPDAGSYGVGVLFLPQNDEVRADCERVFAEIVLAEGQELLGWRTIPTDNSGLGATAVSVEPVMRQVFIRKGMEMSDEQAFERQLYVIRKRAEQEIRTKQGPEWRTFYITSLSCRTIVYKGMLTTNQLDSYFPDLHDPRMESALALVHSRFSTNTFPSWERAHPYRYVVHNGEINTLRGNVNWMHARQSMLSSDLFKDDLQKLLPVIDQGGSDTSMFDNTLEFLVLSGRPLSHVAMMMIPEPWSNHDSMDEARRAFYEYHSCLMEAWDGPAAMVMTDGRQIVALLDRNGLRPARYYVTSDDLIVLASEAGVLDIAPEKIVQKERLRPGRMLLVDLVEKRIVHDEEIKQQIATEHPYRTWLDENLVRLENLPEAGYVPESDHETMLQRQTVFGYTYEEMVKFVKPMAVTALDPVGSMGADTPLAVLSKRPQLLYSYFKQLFAQVTNPPIDAIREEMVTATSTTLGFERNLLKPEPESCRQIELKTPILTNEEFSKLAHIHYDGYISKVFPILFDIAKGRDGLQLALKELYVTIDVAIADGANVLVLSDRGVDAHFAPIPALLAVSGVHHHLIRTGKRTQVALIVESGEPREVHHYALLIGYGASAINPYLALESLDDMIRSGMLTGLTHQQAIKNYVKAVTKGVLKVASKMGISTLQSYHGAQIFEAVGLSQDVIDEYFTWTPSRIAGIGLSEIAQEVRMRHQSAFDERIGEIRALPAGGKLQWRDDGEEHIYSPESIYLLQSACRQGNYPLFKTYSQKLDQQNMAYQTLRSMLDLRLAQQPIPLDEVEPVESIVKRFKTGAMSYGSISQEAHEALAIAMNRLNAKSNTGEGGEDPRRFIPDANGDSRRSAIKQVASGRFGVTSEYLVNADEIQIKMAQGAKPGEGGQLPGKKVYPWIADVRHSTPGVGLISPPPHHDIYSIEDLAELIHDLKNANQRARISVKLVSEVGVGTIAAGVAKGKADVVLISGYDGGTGASPETSIQHAGLPWELGLAETHQTLLLNGLRDRIVVETDGKLMTGRDVVVAALLGAEEFGFATAPLVTLGCVMMRACHLDTCPVGIATQNPELRKNFTGDPAYVENFMRFIAQEVREWMSVLGFRTVTEMVGQSDRLEARKAVQHWKAKGVDLAALLYQPHESQDVVRHCTKKQAHALENTLDMRELLRVAIPALEDGVKVKEAFTVHNTNRVVGTILGSEVTRRYGAQGLPDDTISFKFTGSAGQSFGAFIPRGITLTLVGDGNDYVGKGLSGGRLIIYPDDHAGFIPEDNIIVGNVAFYGATGGEAFIRGQAGERFAVRNSGVSAVIEGVGDHGCEYMTGGRVVVLGRTGRNFAAGMSGGIAYVWDEAGDFRQNCNTEMVDLEDLVDIDETARVRLLIERHVLLTGSQRGMNILAQWASSVKQMVCVIPKDYRRVLQSIQQAEARGLRGADAAFAAFAESQRDPVPAGRI